MPKDTDDNMALAVREEEDAPEEVTGELVTGEGGPREGDTGLSEYIMAERAEDADDPSAAYRRIIAQVLAAETPDEVLVPGEVLALKDMVDHVLEVHAFHENRSEYDVGSPFYFTMECLDTETGEKLVVNTGHQRVMAQLIRLYQLHAYPVTVRVAQGKRPNKYGSFPLRLERP